MPFRIVNTEITELPVDAIVKETNGASLNNETVPFFSRVRTKQKKQKDYGSEKAWLDRNERESQHSIIYVVSPNCQYGDPETKKVIHSCYMECFKIAAENGFISVAVPVFKCGKNGQQDVFALETALPAIRDFLCDHQMMIYIVYQSSSTYFIGCEAAIDETVRYFSPMSLPETENIINEQIELFDGPSPFASDDEIAAYYQRKNLADQQKGKFKELLVSRMDAQHISNEDCCRNANIERSEFDKIRNVPDYRPEKITVLSLAVALRLSIDETKELLQQLNYSFSFYEGGRFSADDIFEYYIVRGKYDIYEIYEALSMIC